MDSILEATEYFNKTGSKESAFIHGVSSAGVAYSIARSCRDGQIAECSCSEALRPKELEPKFAWGASNSFEIYPHFIFTI